MDEFIRFACSKCAQRLKVKAEQRGGRHITCPKCQTLLAIPATGAAPAAAANVARRPAAATTTGAPSGRWPPPGNRAARCWTAFGRSAWAHRLSSAFSACCWSDGVACRWPGCSSSDSSSRWECSRRPAPLRFAGFS